MSKNEIPFSMPYFDEAETAAVIKVLEDKWITTGPAAHQLETEMKKYLQVKTAIALSSCTAALEIALAVHGIGKGDDVITTPYTFSATAMSIIHAGAHPVLVDVEEDTFNIDPAKIKKCIETKYEQNGAHRVSKSTGNALKAIIPVHFAGQPAEMDLINQLAKMYGLEVIEDAAHALDGVYKGTPIGKSENLTCFSFYSNKNMTTGEGGMLVTDSDELEERLRMFSLHGISKSNLERYKTGLPYYDILVPGFKANMPDIPAALGLIQLQKLPEITARRKQVTEWYDEALAEIEEITPLTIKPHNKSAHHLYPILLNGPLKKYRDNIILHMRSKNIFPSVHFIPIHTFSFYKNYFFRPQHLPVSEDLFEREISLPLFPQMEKTQVKQVVNVLKEAVKLVQK